VTDADSHSITLQSAILDPDQNVARLRQVLIKPDEQRRSPWLIGNAADVFDSQRINRMTRIFCVALRRSQSRLFATADSSQTA
jgi:gluconate kinase